MDVNLTPTAQFWSSHTPLEADLQLNIEIVGIVKFVQLC